MSCAEEGVFCERLINLLTISDMDPAYEKYGKAVRTSHSARLEEVSSVRPFHIHDVAHNQKNAEASLTRGTHFDGNCIYDATDLVILLSSVDNELYGCLN